MSWLWRLMQTPLKTAAENDRLKERLRTSETEAAYAKERAQRFLALAPRAWESGARDVQLRQALEAIGPHTASIKYLDTTLSGAGPLAYWLVERFRDAGWHVEQMSVVDGYQNIDRITMRIEDIAHVSVLQQSVLDALRSVQLQTVVAPGHADKLTIVVGNQ